MPLTNPPLINVSGGTTSNWLSQVTFSNLNGVSFGLDGSTITGSHNALTSQSNQAASAANGSFTFQTLSFSNLNGVSFATAAGSALQASIATSLTNIRVSAGTSSANLSAVTFGDLNGISFGLNGSTVTGSHDGLTSQSNQAFSAGAASSAFQTLFFVDSNGVSFSNVAGSLRVTHGLAGTTSGFVGANISGSMTHNSAGLNLSLSVGAGGAETQTAISGISQSQTMYTSGSVIFSEQANITINSSVNGASQYLRFSVAAPGGAGAARSYFAWPEVIANSSTIQASGSSKYLQPLEVPHDLSVSYARLPLTLSVPGSMASIATSVNHTVGLTISSTIQLAFYSLGAGANSRSLQSYFTTSTLWLQQATIRAAGVGSNWSSGYTISFPGESGQNTSSTGSAATTLSNRQFSTTQYTNFTNLRFLNIPMATSFSGGMYWMAYNSSTSLSSSGNANITTVRILASNFAVSQPAQSFNLMGSATNSSILWRVGQGSWSTNSIGTTTASIALSELSRIANNPIMCLDMIRQA